MDVLITGITGFVGSHLSEYLLSLGDIQVHGLARWRSPKDNIKHIENEIHLHYGDLTDYPSILSVINEAKPDFVFHLSAQSYVPYSFRAPVATLDANCQGTCNLLEAIKLSRINNIDPVVLICSSSEVYGQVLPGEVPINENCQLRPASPYAVSKVCEDMLGFQYYLSWGLKIIRSRMFTHCGPRRGDVFVGSNFAKQIAQIEKGKQEPVIKVGNLESIRTFADVRDIVKAYWLMVNRCQFGEVYNVGGDETMSVGEMLNRLMGFSTCNNIRIEVDKTRLRPSDVTLQIPDCSKFKSETGWEPEISFNQTLKDMLDYWRARV